MNDTTQPAQGLLEAIFEGHPAPTFVVDRDAGVRTMNRAARRMLGHERGPAPVGTRRAGDVLRCVESYGPGGCGRQERCKSCVVRNAIVHALSTGSVQRAQTVLRVRRDGDDADMCLLVNASPILPHGGELVVVTLEDVSDVVRLQDEFRRAHQALRESEARFQTLASGAPVGIVLGGEDGEYLFVNEAWQRMTGMTLEQARGKGWLEAVHPEDRDAIAAGWAESVKTGDIFRREFRVRTSQGREAWVQSWRSPLRDEAGGVTGYVGIVVDVTEQKRLRELQERAARAERLASVATLVRGVCHEVNNPLGSLLPNLSYAREQIAIACSGAPEAGASRARACLEEVEQVLRDAFLAADRVREIVADLRTFTSGERCGETRCELRVAVDRALELASHELAPCAGVQAEIPAPLPQIAASCAELAHVFASLLSNAGQATAGENTVRIAARVRDPEHVVVEVSDTGTGIDDAVLPRVFDPFFSTRGVGRGKGLGLSICLGIVRSLGGDIALRSVPGKGTTVTVVLPVQGRSASP